MRLHKKIPVLATVLLLSPTLVFSASVNDGDKAGNYNMALIGLVCLMLVLLFVIGMLANTLTQLTHVIRDKMRKDRQAGVTIVKTILLLLVFSLQGLPGRATQANTAPAVAITAVNGIPINDFYLIMAFISLEFLIIFLLTIHTKSLLKIIANKQELAPVAKAIVKKSWFWDKLNAAGKMEEEKDILLDHNYDGIQELDNSLPPWWKYGFYLTIIVSFIYMYRFHVSHDGLSQQEEYVVEMQKGDEEKAAYLAQSANNVDENSVLLLTDAGTITEGHDLFIKTCAACHLADGGGSVGPNLTDEYWLHGGGIKDIFKSIKYGWQDKGMKSWKDDYSPKQIQMLASFIKSLKGTHPAVPKAHQGDLYIEVLQDKKTVSTDNIDRTGVAKVYKK
jgi:cytochrome c oxidase cbb3-type subunit 3